MPESASTLYFEVAVWAHLIGAGTLLIIALAVGWRVFRGAVAPPSSRWSFRWLTGLLLVLVLAQLLLGCATWVMKYHWPTFVIHMPLTTVYTLIEAHGMLQSVVATAHAANGSLLLGVAVLLAARAYRLVQKMPELGKGRPRRHRPGEREKLG